MLFSSILLAIIIPASVLASTGTVSGPPTSSSAIIPPYPYSNTTFSYHPIGTGRPPFPIPGGFKFPHSSSTASIVGTGTGSIVTVASSDTTTSTSTVGYGKRLIRGHKDKFYYPISYSTTTSSVDSTTTSNGGSAVTAHSTSTAYPTGTGQPTGYPTSYPTGTSGGPLPTGTYGFARYVRKHIL